MKEGFLIAVVLVVAGLALQLSVGPVVWKVFAWPVNGLAMACLLALIATMFLLRRRVWLFRFVGTLQAAVPAMVSAVVLTIVMGLTRQEDGGTWLNDMLTFWPFVLVYAYIALILGLVTLKRLSALPRRHGVRDVAFVLNHLGLFLALTTATLGNADMLRVKMITTIGELEWRTLTEESTVKEMDLAIELKRFIMETYDDGSPKRYASEIRVLTKSGKDFETVVDVNKPCEVEGWKIYQFGYDTEKGPESDISILELVSDPWLPLVYAGIYMMLAGAVGMFVFGKAHGGPPFVPRGGHDRLSPEPQNYSSPLGG